MTFGLDGISRLTANQTPIYVLMAIAISVGTTAIMLAGGKSSWKRIASKVSLLTGASMLVTTLVLLGIQFDERA